MVAERNLRDDDRWRPDSSCDPSVRHFTGPIVRTPAAAEVGNKVT